VVEPTRRTEAHTRRNEDVVWREKVRAKDVTWRERVRAEDRAERDASVLRMAQDFTQRISGVAGTTVQGT